MLRTTVALTGILAGASLPSSRGFVPNYESPPAATAKLSVVESLSQEPSHTPRDGRAAPQDPQAVIADLRAQIAAANQTMGLQKLEIDALKAERPALEVSRDLFNKSNRLRSPMEREAFLRSNSPADLVKAEELHFAASVSETTLKLFATNVGQMFSKPNIDRDVVKLDQFLLGDGVSDAGQRAGLCGQFRKEMTAWGEFVKRPENLRLLVASATPVGSDVAFSAHAADLLAPPLPEDMIALNAAAREYTTAKQLTLGRILKANQESMK